jgi:uncharacterized protein (DUF952 family)
VSDLLHLTTTGPWNDAQGSGVYPIPGGGPYIHLCHPDQLAGVVERFFPGPHGDIVVLTVDPDGLRVVLESADDVAGVFPHLYGELPIDNVTDVRPLGVALAEPGDAVVEA